MDPEWAKVSAVPAPLLADQWDLDWVLVEPVVAAVASLFSVEEQDWDFRDALGHEGSRTGRLRTDPSCSSQSRDEKRVIISIFYLTFSAKIFLRTDVAGVDILLSARFPLPKGSKGSCFVAALVLPNAPKGSVSKPSYDVF